MTVLQVFQPTRVGLRRLTGRSEPDAKGGPKGPYERGDAVFVASATNPSRGAKPHPCRLEHVKEPAASQNRKRKARPIADPYGAARKRLHQNALNPARVRFLHVVLHPAFAQNMARHFNHNVVGIQARFTFVAGQTLQA